MKNATGRDQSLTGNNFFNTGLVAFFKTITEMVTNTLKVYFKMHIGMIRTKTTAIIEKLAKDNNVAPQDDALDGFANAVTELSSDEVTQDYTLDLIVALKRSGVITKAEVTELSINHLNEKKKIAFKSEPSNN